MMIRGIKKKTLTAKIWRFTFSVVFALLLYGVPAVAEEEKVLTSGAVEMGVEEIWNYDSNSSKFNEYRDIDDDFYLYNLWLDAEKHQSGHYLELRGKRIGRDDQNLQLRIGRYGIWKMDIEWDEIPHLYSNRAMSFYAGSGGDVLSAPSDVRSGLDITTVNNGFTGLYITPLEGYIADPDYFRYIALGTEREKAKLGFTYTPTSHLTFHMDYTNEHKGGTIKTGAIISPVSYSRALATELPEPVDYRTQELRLSMDYAGKTCQAEFSYYLSAFDNNYDSLAWDNLYIPNQASGWKAVGGSRRISDNGSMALPPNNIYHNGTLSFGVNLPWQSRLMSTFSYGFMKQNENILPYSTAGFGYTGNWDSIGSSYLPRTEGDDEKKTYLFNLKYTINPLPKLNLSLFYRYYDMDNDTRKDIWQYVVADGTSGDPALDSTRKRYNMPHDYERQNVGLDAYYNISHILKGTTIGLGYERETYEREFRAVDESREDKYTFSINSRPVRWLSIKTKYLHAERDGDTYKSGGGIDGDPSNQSYPDYLTMTNDSNPWSSNPDLRQYDIAERETDKADLTLRFDPFYNLSFSTSYTYKKSDYEDTTGWQTFGIEKDENHAYTVDATFLPNDRLTTYAYFTREKHKMDQSGRSFEHDNEVKEGLGAGMGWDPAYPDWTWDDPLTNWWADTDDNTDTFGIGINAVLIPETLDFFSDFTISRSMVDIDVTYGPYAASNVDEVDPLENGAWSPPSTARTRLITMNAGLKYYPSYLKGWTMAIKYLFERYKRNDWAEEPMEDNLDFKGWASGESTRAGNVLVGLGYLAPDYEAHVGSLTLTYKW